MKDNRKTLQELFDQGRIDLRRGPVFDLDPGPMPESFDFERVEGMMLGLAIGDSLGNSSEGMNPEQRRARWGEVRDYLPHPWLGDARGYPSDDTQLAFWTLKQMIADGGFDPERVAAAFCSGHIFGIGASVKEFLRNCKDRNRPWYQRGPKSAGNGALMRIAPMVIPHLRTGTSRLWADTALSAMLTHNDSGSIAACVAFVHMLRRLLCMETPPPPEWWLDSYVQVAQELEVDESYQPRGGAFLGYRGPIWRFVQERLSEAYAKGQSALEACDSWYSGAYLLETVPSVLYILMLHAHDPEEAIVRAVNDTHDNDTIGAIVGAAVGALHGTSRLPGRWVSGLSGRTREDDDGEVFRLLEEAGRTWWTRAQEGDDPGRRSGGSGQGRRSLMHISGCLLGGAVGDALGAPVEFMSLEQIRNQFGQQGLTGYAPVYGRAGGAITDDTQMTLFTAEGLIRADNRWRDRGICNPAMVLHHSYLRWLGTQGRLPERVLAEVGESWLFGVRGLHAARPRQHLPVCPAGWRNGQSGGTRQRQQRLRGRHAGCAGGPDRSRSLSAWMRGCCHHPRPSLGLPGSRVLRHGDQPPAPGE